MTGTSDTRAGCARATMLLERLDAAAGSAIEAGPAQRRAEVASGTARDETRAEGLTESETQWLAAHLEGCAACGAADDALTRGMLETLGAARTSDLPDADYFAARHAEVMAAVRAEPRPALRRGTAHLRREGTPGATDRARRAPTAQRGATLRWRRSRWRAATGLALAAGAALVVLARGGWRSGAPLLPAETENRMVAVGGDAAVASQDSEPLVDEDVLAAARGVDGEALQEEEGAWLVASGDSFLEVGDVSLEELSDAELEELAAVLAAEQG